MILLRLLLRAKSLLAKDRLDDQLTDELAFHLEQQKAELIASGLTEAEADRQARRLFGPVSTLREQCRDTRRTLWLEDFAQDVRHTLRNLRASASFSTVAILTLALGIGANTAFFSTAYGILFRPLPYPQPDRLIDIEDGISGIGPVTTLRSLSKTTDYAGYFFPDDFNLQLAGQASRVLGATVTFNLARVLAVQPQIGRWFLAAEERRAGPTPIVLSDHFWRHHLNADPGVLSRQIVLNEKPHQVIGVMPPSFAFPTPQTAFWLPIDLDPRQLGFLWGRGGFWPIGRLNSASTIETAQAEIKPLTDTVRKMFPWPMPDAYAAASLIQRHDRSLSKQVRPKLLVLSAATLLLLLIACGNVGNLLLARSIQREREFSLREALGATNARLLRQLLTENLILVLLGGAGGLITAIAIYRALPSLFPKDTPRLNELATDPTLWLGAASSLILTIVLFTVAPLFTARSRESLAGRSITANTRTTRLSLALIGVELALATTLLIGASLMGRTLWQLSNTDSGIQATNIVSARISAGPSRCPNLARCLALIEDISQTLTNQAAVRKIDWTNYTPLDKEFASAASDIEDHPRPPRQPAHVLWQTAITPGYFRTLGIPLLEGRAFTSADRPDSQLVTIISRSTANRFWPNQSPIGKHVRVLSDLKWRTIVGVVADVSQYSLSGFPTWVDGVQYIPLSQTISDNKQTLQLSILLETSNSQWAAQIRQRYPDIVISKIATLGEVRSESVQDQRSTATLLALFATLGLILGIAGVHGVISHRAAQRTKEIGIRLALGASGPQVIRMVIEETLLVSTIGAATGMAAAFALSRYLKTLIFGITIYDPWAFTLSPIALLLAAAIAAALPAIEATHTDPATVLRD